MRVTTPSCERVRCVQDMLSEDGYLALAIARHLHELSACRFSEEMPLSVELALRKLARDVAAQCKERDCHGIF